MFWYSTCNCACRVTQFSSSDFPYLIAPGPVLELSYEVTMNTSVRITWKPPKEYYGDLVAYSVEHGVYQNESTVGVRIDARRPLSTVIQAFG